MDQAAPGDFGLGPDPAVEAARREALEYLRLEQWGHPLPPLTPSVAHQVSLLRQERLDRQEAARRAHRERNEAERQVALRAQAERERRQVAEEAGEQP
jgi:hypothetical protein